jgi:hypothetical protein
MRRFVLLVLLLVGATGTFVACARQDEIVPMTEPSEPSLDGGVTAPDARAP